MVVGTACAGELCGVITQRDCQVTYTPEKSMVHAGGGGVLIGASCVLRSLVFCPTSDIMSGRAQAEHIELLKAQARDRGDRSSRSKASSSLPKASSRQNGEVSTNAQSSGIVSAPQLSKMARARPGSPPLARKYIARPAPALAVGKGRPPRRR